jgi:hypothetical protein
MARPKRSSYTASAAPSPASLGDWHFHPGASAHPSSQDVAQMQAIASDPNYQCRRTVLVLVGGDLDGDWSLTALVIGRGWVIDLNERPLALR